MILDYTKLIIVIKFIIKLSCAPFKKKFIVKRKLLSMHKKDFDIKSLAKMIYFYFLHKYFY